MSKIQIAGLGCGSADRLLVHELREQSDLLELGLLVLALQLGVLFHLLVEHERDLTYL